MENNDNNISNVNNYYYTHNNQNSIFEFTMIDSLSSWMKFLGIYTIVTGAITCLGIITAAIGVPMIFAGISIKKASNNIKVYKTNNSPYILNEVFNYLNKYFKIQGILAIIGIAFSVIYLVILMITLAMSFAGFMY